MSFVPEGQAWVRLYIWTEAPAPQGLQNSAQGFNPGNPQNERFALKRREMRVPNEARTYGGAKVRVRNWDVLQLDHRTPLPPC
jgi:hypothetical protein